MFGNQHPRVEQRINERIAVAFPVCVAKANFVTRDISPSGIFIETQAKFELGERVGLMVKLGNPGNHLMLKADGEIVRLENNPSKAGIAVKILAANLQSTYLGNAE